MGLRLDVFLAERLGLSRRQVRRLLDRASVKVSGRLARAGDKGVALLEGAEVEVLPFRRPEDERAIPEADPKLAVLARGPGWLVIDKPAGVPVHPLREGERGSLLSGVSAQHPEIHGVGEGALRSGVVHRLDVDTSGCIVFATRQQTWQRLRAAFHEHRVEKVYRALVRGRLEPGEVRLGLVMARHRPARVRVMADSEVERARGVRWSETRWRSVEHFENATLVEARPRTGHLHQLRATFAHLGHPLLGDSTYADSATARAAPRHMLHASQVRFEEVEAVSSDAADFSAALARLRDGA
ncbi:RluA family pseudouridine synthase [Myxococcota bacterium]|nr:RluA family pseudouridine synthase [Myxococcota bacterium]